LLGVICFHAQQCVEKYLKALLTLHAIDFPKTHDLLDLLRRIPPSEAVRIRPEEIGGLNRYSIEGRYPGDWEPITREEAEAALAVARQVRETMRGPLSLFIR
jgi:HEPN domain-containing protein